MGDDPPAGARGSSAGAYAAIALAVVAGEIALALGAGERLEPLAAGALGAWTVQAISFWRLDVALAAGRSAVRAWVAGIAARLGGLVVAGVTAAAADVGPRLPVWYALTLFLLLLVEAAWLSRRSRPSRVSGRMSDQRTGAEARRDEAE